VRSVKVLSRQIDDPSCATRDQGLLRARKGRHAREHDRFNADPARAGLTRNRAAPRGSTRRSRRGSRRALPAKLNPRDHGGVGALHRDPRGGRVVEQRPRRLHPSMRASPRVARRRRDRAQGRRVRRAAEDRSVLRAAHSPASCSRPCSSPALDVGAITLLRQDGMTAPEVHPRSSVPLPPSAATAVIRRVSCVEFASTCVAISIRRKTRTTRSRGWFAARGMSLPEAA